MRITIVLGAFLPVPPVLGGAVEKVQLLLADAYLEAGHDVTVISRRYKNFPDEETVKGVKYLRVGSFERSKSLAVNLILTSLYALRVARCLPKSDITVTNTFLLPMLLNRRTAGKIYVHIARFPKHQMFLYFRADRLQAVSHVVAEEIVRQTPHLSNKVVTIGNPVSSSYFTLNPIQQRKKVVLFVGRIAREKGVHLLIESFVSMVKHWDQFNISEWSLRIVGPHDVAQGGDGPEYLSELVRLAQPLGSSCSFVGPIFEERALIKEYQAASIFVYPSLAEKGEAFGLAPLEAMAAGCAVVVSNLQCFNEYVEEGRNALKFEHSGPSPEESLAGKLTLLMAAPQSIVQIARNGNIAARRFEASAIASKMLRDFELLVSGS